MILHAIHIVHMHLPKKKGEFTVDDEGWGGCDASNVHGWVDGGRRSIMLESNSQEISHIASWGEKY